PFIRQDRWARQSSTSGAPVTGSVRQARLANWLGPGRRSGSANRAATRAWSARSTLTENIDARRTRRVNDDDARRQAPSTSGSRETATSALTVVPWASPPSATVSTVTPEAKRRRAARATSPPIGAASPRVGAPAAVARLPTGRMETVLTGAPRAGRATRHRWV